VKSALVWLVMLFTAYFLAMALAPSGPTAALMTGVAVLAVTAILGARYLAVSIVALTLRVGSRSRQHREVLSEMVSPKHPNIAGRPRTRAPARSEVLA
jgi:hypothetical protein